MLTTINVSKDELIHLIWKQIYELYGVIEGARFGFKLLEWDDDKKRGIARVNWKYLDKFRIVLGTIFKGKTPILLNDILVAGTQASLRRKLESRITWDKMAKKIREMKEKYFTENGDLDDR